MADYGAQQGREYGRQYGHPANVERDAAFNHIFGGGRSQTMTSQPPPQPRAQSMASEPRSPPPPPPDMMPRAPPVRPGQHPGHHPGSYAPRPTSAQRPPSGPYERPFDGPMPPMAHRQPNPQHLPPPLRPDRRPYGAPQRMEPPRPGVGPYPSMNRPIPNRYPSGPPPAMNSDGYRSQSLASQPRPNFPGPGQQPPGPNPYHIAPAHTFRQQPYLNHQARTTAQGRVVPERPDERSMTMASYIPAGESRQTMSGRVIPDRRRESPQGDSFPEEGVPPRSYAPSGAPVTHQTKPRSTSHGSDMQPRTMSMASTIVQPDRTSSLSHRSSSSTAISPTDRTSSMSGRTATMKSTSGPTQMVSSRKSPLVYPAMLSKVGAGFRENIALGEKSKDGLEYKNAFTGAEAVDLIAYIIKTQDRNLALLLGRSLDAQKFFHDVTYAHRLRDSSNEVYQFHETLMEGETEVNGVFTLMADCYSPTCTPYQLCYSIACPRRLEQQARLNLKPQHVLKRQDSRSSLHDQDNNEQKLWINTVSKEVADSIGDQEKKRQEVLSELMYTERDFVKDLEYLRDFWMKPLRSHMGSPIPDHRREKFVRIVFSNCQEVYMVNSRMAESLTRRQQQNPVVHNVGDIFLEYVPRFTPFIKYGANQLFGKYEFENEKRTNPQFAKFVEQTERMKESRKLELNGYLTKPTTRLARYPLLLEGILKYTADDNPDKEDLPKAIVMIKQFLSQVNVESGKAENHFNLQQLNRELKFRPGEYVDLKLTDEARQLLFKGMLKKTPAESNSDMEAFLFDHAFLLVRHKMVNKKEELKMYRKPIPLELLHIPQMDDIIPKPGLGKRTPSGMMTNGRTNTMTGKTEAGKAQAWPITFKHLGKDGYEQTLFCSSSIQQQKWIEHIDKQQRLLREKSKVFTKTILNEGYFNSYSRVSCCVPFDGGRKLVLGTDVGVFLTDRKPKDSSFKPKKVLDVKAVTQIDILENYGLLLVLSEKTLFTFPIEALDPDDGQYPGNKRGKKIGHAQFFKAGVCQGRHLVATVKTSALSTVIKVHEPAEQAGRSARRGGLARMLGGSQEVLKLWKEFYVPSEATSIHFLRSKLCVGCTKGFEVLSLETNESQSLLDQADTSLDFVQSKENIKPIHIERVVGEFLLCYSDYSFYVNRNGWRARPEYLIKWEGTPQWFAIFAPYILAFEPSFIEMRHMESGVLVHILTAKNIRMLHSSTREILYAYEDEMGEDDDHSPSNTEQLVKQQPPPQVPRHHSYQQQVVPGVR
ncbi:CNH-domain-containing protein [Eremomyces bilateralis CBS 781.70]|uniref:CNH-domain-containing protein n=1 Tax=Eremomyces bilateralis CBS 781.70 TaxID=1392243 RepID=A0A6G1GFK5_9PEZI|nr:CNH-domain-containing protein [Eremomyces bilateralis CBS 781.70]KAF1816659.1 CNH-domain-containing protein [Eremomyces bilateralis CBS 781.70]